MVQGVDGKKPPTALIVGVAGTAKYRSLREVNPPIYYSVSNAGTAGMFLYVRTSRSPAGILRDVREIMRRIDPAVPLIEAFTLEQELQASLWHERLVMLLAGFFGGFALLISAMGIYGTLAYSVARRSRELGIRIAVGAQIADVVRTVCGRVMRFVGIGFTAGVLGSLVLLRWAGGLFFGVGPADPFSLSAAAGLLLCVSVLAVVSPARRAAKTDPIVALREE